jgi:hypothetical protein
MRRFFLIESLTWAALVLSAVANAQDKAGEPFLRRVDAADLQSQIDVLKKRIVELEADIAQKKVQIADLERRKAAIESQRKAGTNRLREFRALPPRIQPPLMFPVNIERAMLGDGVQLVPRQKIFEDKLELPDRPLPHAPGPKR